MRPPIRKEFRDLLSGHLPGLDVSRETLDRLIVYAEALTRWQQQINLVASSTLDAMILRHFVDSAQIVSRPTNWRTWIDLGSGAGFPGMVVAILCAKPGEDRTVCLVESDSRKAAFLRHVASATETPVYVVNERIERISPQDRGNADIVSARALAPLGKLLTFAHPWLESGATGVFLKGKGYAAEVEIASHDWTFEWSVVDSLTETGAVVMTIESVGRRVYAGKALK